MKKSRAALIHLWPSLLALIIAAGIILFMWYPAPFLPLTESDTFAVLLILSAFLIGPALTLLIYREGKRGLVADLIIIILIQLAAFGWGMHALYRDRPYFMVFTLDRFEVLSLREVDMSQGIDPRFLNKPITWPALLYATMPKDSQSFQNLLKEVMFEGKPDLQFRPQYWSLFEESQKFALESSRPLHDLRVARSEETRAIDQLVVLHGGDISDLRFVPVVFRDASIAAILDADNGALIDTLVIDPWLK